MAPDVAGSIPVIHPIHSLKIESCKLKIGFAVLTFVVLVLVPVRPCAAQEGTRTPVEHQQTISTSPVADILGFLNGEYQRKITDGVAVGVSAGTIEFDDDRYTNGMVFGRYYPQGAALTGFFIGGRIGFHRVTYESYFFGPDDPFPGERRDVTTRKATTRAAIGIDVGYDWLLGSKRNVLIGVGAGGMRLFGSDRNDNILIAFPTARLNVGFAF